LRQIVDYIMLVVYYCRGWGLHPTMTESIIGRLAGSLRPRGRTYATATTCCPGTRASRPATKSAPALASSVVAQLHEWAISAPHDLNFPRSPLRSPNAAALGATTVAESHRRSYGGWLASQIRGLHRRSSTYYSSRVTVAH